MSSMLVIYASRITLLAISDAYSLIPALLGDRLAQLFYLRGPNGRATLPSKMLCAGQPRFEIFHSHTLTMQIREFIWPDDFDAVTDLWQASGLHNPTIDGLDNLRDVCRRNPGLFLLAVEGARIVGSVIGTFDGRRGYIYHVVVHPDSRRKGYATLLLREVERRLWAMGVQKIRFMVSKSNESALAFYRTLAFEVDVHSYSMSKK